MSRNKPRARAYEDSPRAWQYVMIRYVCAVHGDVMAEVGMETDEASDRRVWMNARADGTIPEDAQHPGKMLAICPRAPRCRREKQVTQERLTDELNAMWKPRAHEVVTYRV